MQDHCSQTKIMKICSTCETKRWPTLLVLQVPFCLPWAARWWPDPSAVLMEGSPFWWFPVPAPGTLVCDKGNTTRTLILSLPQLEVAANRSLVTYLNVTGTNKTSSCMYLTLLSQICQQLPVSTLLSPIFQQLSVSTLLSLICQQLYISQHHCHQYVSSCLSQHYSHQHVSSCMYLNITIINMPAVIYFNLTVKNMSTFIFFNITVPSVPVAIYINITVTNLSVVILSYAPPQIRGQCVQLLHASCVRLTPFSTDSLQDNWPCIYMDRLFFF